MITGQSKLMPVNEKTALAGGLFEGTLSWRSLYRVTASGGSSYRIPVKFSGNLSHLSS